MKKKAVLFFCVAAAGCLLSGCTGTRAKETEMALETFAENQSGSRTIISDAGTVQFKGETSKDEVYDFGYKASDYITLGDYSSIKVPKTETKDITDNEIQARISEQMRKNKIWIDKTEGTVNKYDLVNMDIICMIDGKTYDAESLKDTNINIGSGNYFPEFENQLIGKQIGDTVKFQLSLPDNTRFSGQSGKNAEFTVYLKAVRTQPQLTDEIAAKLSGEKYQSAEEYKAFIRQSLEDEKQEQQDSEVFMEIINQISDTIEIKGIPEAETEDELTYENIQQEAKKKGITPAELVQKYESEGKIISMNSTEEHSMDLLLLYIADQNGITVTGSDIAEYRTELQERGTYSEEEISTALNERKLAHLALNKKVVKYIAEMNET